MQLIRIFPALFLAAAVSAQGQSVSTNGIRPITLDEAVTEALQRNFDVQIQKLSPEIARYSLGFSYASYDPVFFASGQHGFSQSPGGLDAQARQFTGNETENDTLRTGFSGLLPTGMSYQISANATDAYGTRPNVQTGLRDPFESTTASLGAVTLTQPLLKNFWIDGPRASISIAKNRLKYSEQAFRFQLMQTITAVEQAYYNLIFARENVKVQDAALRLVQTLLEENKKKVAVGAMAQLDQTQAESQVATSQADMLSVQRVLDSEQNAFKSLITDKFQDLYGVNLVPAENLVAVPEAISLQDSWRKGLELRPDLVQARLDMKRSDITVRLDKNQLFPQLDLVGQYGYAGTGREFSGAIAQINDTLNPFWYYGAQLSIPLGNRTARNNYKIAKAQREQLQLMLKQKEQNIMVEIDDAVKLVQSNYGRVQATREARKFAEAALDAEQKKLENGKSTSFFVLQFQRDLTAARFAEIRALAEYNTALSQHAFREGSTLDRHKLNINVK
jgi:outer membrane protein TolC